jgi:DNA invertase Pin-like site-specific DNA recombinase
MLTDRPPEITPKHLARTAVVYLRQSTDEQVQHNTGSTDYQRGQIRYPQGWGWPAERIETIDTDLGLSGAAAHHRPGYQRLVAQIERDEVGAIFLADMSRCGRDATEWFRLLTLCHTHDVLIVLDGNVYDMNNSSELLTTRLLATLAEHDNLMRRETMQRGRLAKAAKGQAVSAPPAGYVRAADVSWEQDPDPNVRAAIGAVLRTFLSERSCSRALDALRRQGVQLPRRRRVRLLWTAATVTKIYRLLIHPAYAGTYRYRWTVIDPRAGRDARGRVRMRRAAEHETIIVRDHHAPYISLVEWEEIQRILALNGPSEVRRNLGPGTALVQGLIRCGIHRQHAMSTAYKAARRDGGRSYSYNCIGDYHEGGPQCGYLAGRQVDEAVTDAMLARLAPPRLETLRAVLKDAAAGDRSEQYRRKLECDRLRREVTVLEEKFYSLDPSSTELAKETERRLEARKRELKDVERILGEEPRSTVAFGDEAMRELIAICAELRTLWTAPTTSSHDRKQIARLLIDKVVLEHRDPQRVRLRIEWADGGPPTEIGFTLLGYTNALITQMHADGLGTQQIADRLNELGITTRGGRTWQRTVVAQKLRRLAARRARCSERAA